jgi:hypothetical protein
MSDCCLPNLGCLSIPIINTDVAGTPGAPGAAATIDVGTVTTVNPGDPATVTNSGTTSAAIFDFEIPEGAQGATGGAGVNGVSRLFASYFFGNTSSAATSTWTSMDTYTLAGGSLANIGDSVVINYEVELLLANQIITALGNTFILSPLRRISIASGATSLTKFDATNVLAEPYLTDLSAFTANQIYSYKVTVELIKVAASNFSNNIIRKCTFDYNIPSTPYSFSNGSGLLISINTGNPIIFSFDIYQYQSTEIRLKNATIDKITAVAP